MHKDYIANDLRWIIANFIFRAKLREYEVTQIQNYDNPMYTGQHTPAERYGSMDSPWNTWMKGLMSRAYDKNNSISYLWYIM